MNFSKLKDINSKKRITFHPYFTSQPHSLVSKYIEFFSKKDEVVLDSFVGSGVTLIESRLLHRHSIGIDLSSFACFIADLGSTNFKKIEEIEKYYSKIEAKVSKHINKLYSKNEFNLKIDDLWKPENIDLPTNSDVKKLYDLFTRRNFSALTVLINEINSISDYEIRKLFRGIFSGILHRASKTFFYDKLNWGGGNSSIFTKFRYWVPKNPNERNVWSLFEIRYKRILSLIKKINMKLPDNYEPLIYNESSNKMDSISNESIDYVYIDPPYGSNINYLDLSTIWRAWLELPLDESDRKLEVIEGGDIKNTKEQYMHLLKESISEIFRVLKYDKYFSIAFSHKDLTYWYSILNSCQNVGFEYINTMYYSPFYNSYHKIKNPLRTLSGQMIINFKKVGKPKKISQNNIDIDFSDYIVKLVKDILLRKGESKTEVIFNELVPQLLENGILKQKHTKTNIVKILEDNFLFNSTESKWTSKKSIVDQLIEKLKEEVYDFIVIDFPNINSEYEISKIDNLLDKIDKILSSKGTLWILCNHKITGNKLLPIPFIIADKFANKNFFVQNIITWPHKDDRVYLYKNFYTHILFITKNKKDYYFNKDLIREKHIWKNIEWGKRSFRYNIKGKDPGNIWIPTEDDGKGHVTKHIILSKKDVFNRIISTSCEYKAKVLIISNQPQKEFLPYLNQRKAQYHIIKLNSINSNQKELNLNVQKYKPIIKKPSTYSHKIYFSTSENMKHIKDKSINLIVTSPPYWDLKNYETDNQIGYQETYNKYLLRLEEVWKECKRVLKDDGSIWININSRTIKGKYYGIQNDFIKSFQKLGLNLVDAIIWHKSSGIPVGEKNLTDRFEYILGFVKSNLKKVIMNDDYFQDYINKEMDRNIINVWNMNRISGSLTKGLPHPAMYPEELPRRLIKLHTQIGDTVLDPFLGSGSTSVAAILENRNSIGYELNLEYKKIIKVKLEKVQGDLFSSFHNIEFISD